MKLVFFSVIVFVLAISIFPQPSNLHATAVTSKSVALTWDATSAHTYQVFMDTMYIQTTTGTSYTIYNLESNRSYRCQVADSGGPRSASIDVVTSPFVPDSGCINPYTDLVYLGAFKPPENEIGSTFEYGQSDLAFRPDGDPSSADSFPGSLFIAGHIYDRYIAEISIPEPVLSRNTADLPMAVFLQQFSNLKPPDLMTGSVTIGPSLEYLPPQGVQTEGYLYACYGDNYQVSGNRLNSFSASTVDFSDPDIYGGWYVGPTANYSSPAYMATTKILFSMPWPSEGRALICGGNRWGYGGNGPNLYAFSPWQAASPLPGSGTVLPVTIMLQYGEESYTENCLQGARENDIWAGGACIGNGNASAIAISGNKAVGTFQYQGGGPVVTGFIPMMLFYRVPELMEVASGTTPSYEPQPYAVLDLTRYLFRNYYSSSTSGGPFGMAYDEARGVIYLIEWRAYGNYNTRPLIHVFRLNGSVMASESAKHLDQAEMVLHISPNPFNPAASIGYDIKNKGHVRLEVYNPSGRLQDIIVDDVKGPGTYFSEYHPSGPAGVYMCRIMMNGIRVGCKKMIYIK